MEGVLILNRYRIICIVAVGSQAKVYRGFDERMYKMPVAIKIYPISSKTVSQRLIEVMIVSKLTHPGIIRALDYWVADDESAFAIVFEWIEGMLLHDYIYKLSKRERAAFAHQVLVQVVSTLHALHNHPTAPCLHLDIKPDNILVDASGTVKLIDFGLARFVNDNAPMEGFGHPSFSSPELLSGIQPNFQSDYYSVGAVLYYILNKQAIRNHRDLTKAGWTTFVSIDFVRIIMKLLEFSTNDRYFFIDELQEDIQNLNYYMNRIVI
jgi:serine/threonine-protein kinase